VDQVGVKAPGRPTSKIFLSFAKSAILYFLGGKPWCNSTDGSWSPTDANERTKAGGRAIAREAKPGLKREANNMILTNCSIRIIPGAAGLRCAAADA
jgi:hypothetical protein